MNPALLIRLRPVTPWRIGPESGAPDQAAPVLHSDALFSAVTSAFAQLGLLEEWLAACVRENEEPVVRLSSLFPWQRSYLYAPPPAGLWPPSETHAGHTGKVRWKGARLLPLSVTAALLRGEAPQEDEWTVDAQSGSLIPAGSRSATGPFRYLRRSSAAVDRLTGGLALPHSVTCLQFAPASGLWCAAEFVNPTAYAIWAPKLQAAFRLLADSGLGGMRSRGFGRARTPDFQAGPLGELLLGEAGDRRAPQSAWWLLSLFSPGSADEVDWTGGNYRLIVRSGRVASPQHAGPQKLASRMVEEGSVLKSKTRPRGAARNVAPPGCPHPVWRAGYALSLPIPWPVNA